MNLKDVQAKLDHIRNIVSDNESAHCAEDDLYLSVLRAIANGTCDEPAACARLALTALEIEFTRWYA